MISGRLRLVCGTILATALTPQAWGLRTNPAIPEASDRGSLVIPFGNDPESDFALEQVRLELSIVPPWMGISPDSELGPVDIFPGERHDFVLRFLLNPLVTANSAGVLNVRIVQRSTDATPAMLTWEFETKDGFLHFFGHCTDDAGRSCGDALSPDSSPPISTVTFGSRHFVDSRGVTFVAPGALISLSAEDQSNRMESSVGNASVRYGIDSPASSFESLPKAFFSPLSVADGEHALYYASADEAGNDEDVRISSVIVDGTPPAAPLQLEADGTNPSPWNRLGQYTVTWQNPQDPSGIAEASMKMPDGAREFFPASGQLGIDLSGRLANGPNLLSVQLRDNVGNEGPSASVALLFDDVPPISLVSSPSTAAAGPLRISFEGNDPGSGIPSTGSGLKSVSLWYRYATSGQSPGPWIRSLKQNEQRGEFVFVPEADGDYGFLTQAEDMAGNAETVDGDSLPKTITTFDSSPPRIFSAYAPSVTPSLAEIRWMTDDETTNVIDYGTSTVFGRSVIATAGRAHAVSLDCHLLSPATIYYRITSINRTGLTTVSPIHSFVTPLDISIPADTVGLVDQTAPIELYVTNPLLDFINLHVSDGVSITTSVVLPDGVTRLTALLDGLTINAYFPLERPSHESLLPLVASAGGLAAQSGSSSQVELIAGEPVVGPPSTGSLEPSGFSGASRLYTGLISRIDPVAPYAAADVSTLPGPDTGQLLLAWTAPGDDASVGMAMSYDLRIATSPISQATFPAAASVSLPPPRIAGSREETILSGLDATTTYYFALKAVDELLNASPAAFANGRPLAPAEPVTSAPVDVIVIHLSSAVTQPPPAPSIQIAIASGASVSGWQTLSIAINDFKFTTQFLVDTATRSARLARLAIDAASVITDTAATPGSSMADFAAGQAAVGPDSLSSALPMNSGYSLLELGHYVGVDPVAPSAPGGLQVAPGPDPGTLLATWSAPGDDAAVGTAMEYDLRLSPQAISEANFSAATRIAISTLPARAGSVQQAIISGLADGADYFVALKAFDELLNPSAIAASGAARTSQVVASAAMLAGRPVIGFYSAVPGITITAVSTTTTNPAVALATSAAAAQGLVFASDVFDIVSPDPSLPGGATIQFRYPDLGDSSLESSLRIYHFKPALGQWILLADLGPDTINDLFTAPVASLSLFAVFLKDRAPPVSSVRFLGGRQLSPPSSGVTYASTDTLVGFEAYDAALGPLPSSGLDRVDYAVDGENSFRVFKQPFALAEGAHSVRFRGVDRAGNQEVLRGVIVSVDGTGPRISMDFDRSYQRLVNGIIVVPDQEGTVRLSFQDPSGSGFKTASVTIGSQSEPAGTVFERRLSLGQHALRVVAEDNLGNRSEMSASIVIGDLLPPELLTPKDGFSTSASSVAFSWRNASEKLISLESYELLVSTNQDLADGSLAARTTAQIPVAVSAQDPMASLQNITVQNGQAVLITNTVPGQPVSGTTNGVWESPFITLPSNVQRIQGFQATQAVEQGTISHQYTVDGSNWYNIASLPYQSYFPLIDGAPRIKFRATLARQTLSRTSPRLSAIFFIAIRGAGFPAFIAATNASNTLLDLERAGDWVRLITVLGPTQTTGTLTGSWTSPAVPIPAGAFKVLGFAAQSYGGQGAISLQFAGDGATYQDIGALETLDLSSVPGPLRFRATLSRGSVSDATPSFGGVSFSFALPPPTTATVTLSGEGRYFWAVRSRDFAGRTSEMSDRRSLSVDRTPPAIVVASPSTGQSFVVSRGSVAVAYSVGDNLDHSPSVSGGLRQLEDRGRPRGERPAVLSVTHGQTLDPSALDDGVWELVVTADDSAGNRSTATSGAFQIIHDAQPPRTSLAISTPQAASGALLVISRATALELASHDDLVEAGDLLGLGVARQYLSVAGVQRATFTNEAVSTEAFRNSFSLSSDPDGLYGLGYLAEDVLGNSETVRVTTVAVDNSAPATTLSLLGPSFGSYVSSSAVLSLASADLEVNGVSAGVASSRYRINGGSFIESVSSFTLAGRPDGLYTVDFHSTDRISNEEVLRSSTVLLDQTAPLTRLTTQGGVQYSHPDEGTLFVSSGTMFLLPASDPEVEGVASGLALTVFQDSELPVTAYLGAFTLPEGHHALAYRSEDRVGNLEVWRSTAVLVDATAPISSSRIGAPHHVSAEGVAYITPETPVSFSAVDPSSAGVYSGVARIEISVDGSAFSAYSTTMTFSEGRHEVAFRAVDRVGNTEAARILSLRSDSTPPLTSFQPSGSLYTVAAAEGARSYAPLHFSYTLPANDPVAENVASGVSSTRFRIDAGSVQHYAAALTLAEGIRRIEFQSQDNVDNLELLRGATVFVDATAPESAVSIGLPRYDPGAGRPVLVSFQTPLSLSAQDPLVQDVASGVREISFRRGTEDFSAYDAPFTLPPVDGVKSVEYLATDNVGNAEARRTTSVALDNTPPETAIAIIGGRQYPGPDTATVYASSDTRITLPAADPPVNGVAAGLALTRYRDNGAAFHSFSSAFGLPEGSHLIEYQSQDNVENLEVLRSTSILVDATPPTAMAHIGVPFFVAADGINYIAPATPITLAAADAALPGGRPGSGVSRVEVAVDGGAFATYTGVLSFAEGRHVILFRAVDNVGNVEAAQTLEVQSDATAPESLLAALGGKQAAGADAQTFYASSDTRLALIASDPVAGDVASGVALTEVKDNGGVFQTLASAFSLAEGVHALQYRSKDNVNNLEVLRSTTVLVDATAPVSTFAIGGPYYKAADGTKYITPATPVTFSAADPLVSGVASQVARIEVSIDGSNFMTYASALTFDEGRHTVLFRATDRVGNAEAEQRLELQSDRTPPLTSFHASGSLYTAEDSRSYAPLHFSYTLPAADPVAGDVASGVSSTLFRMDGGAIQRYSSAFTLPEGIRRVEFQSQDNVENLELLRGATVFVDATAPVSSLAVGLPRCDPGDGSPVFVSVNTPLALSAEDPVTQGVASGLREISFRRGDDAFTDYGAPFTLPLPDGVKTIEYFATDKVGNPEGTRSTRVALDNTSPRTSLAVLGGTQLPGPDTETFYASSDTRFALPAEDPVANEVASGLALTRFQDNGSAFQSYASAFVLSEGVHALGYQSRDRVENLEVLRSTTVLVDATSPITVSHIGTPSFVSPDGTKYITPATPVSFTASDPALPGGRAGSGVLRMEVAIDGGPFSTYVSALTFAEGRHVIEFRAIDNVGNAEAVKTLKVHSDDTPPGTAFAASGSYYSEQGPDGRRDFAPQHFTYTLPAVDPVVNEVASGVDVTRYQVDGGAVQTFGGAFALSEGIRRVEFHSQDRVAKRELPKSATVYVDATTPVTTLAVLGGRQHSGPDSATFYASSATRYNLPATDPEVNGVASGLLVTEFQDNGAPFQAFGSPIALTEGVHALSYRSRDRVLNLEVARSTTVLVDATPPVTMVHIGQPFFVAKDGANFITPATPITFTAVDPALPGTSRPGSQPALIEVSIDGGPFTAYASALTFAEGRHTVLFRAIDNVGNVEAAQLLEVRSDATAPVSTLAVGTPQHRRADGTLVVSSLTQVGIPASDPVVSDVASGVKEVLYRISDLAVSTGGFRAFNSPFTLTGADVSKTIEFYSLDNVLNTETPKAERILLDSTYPEVALLSPPSCESGICRVVNGRFPVLGTAQDLHFKNYLLEYAPGRDASTGFVRIAGGSGPILAASLGTWDTSSLSEWQTLRLTATDLVDNVTVLALSVFVGDPSTLMSLGNHETFNMPEGVAVGPQGRVYVADRNNDRVAIFSSTGTLLASIAPALNKPQGVAVDLEGNLLIADTNNSRVVRVSQEGQVLLELARRNPAGHTLAGKGPGEFSKPSGVAVDGLGAIYVADTLNERIQIFSSSGVFVREFDLPPAVVDGNIVAGQPTAIAVDAAGRVYVADGAAGRALRFTGTGALELELPIRSEEGVRGTPSGIAATPSGECIVVSDSKGGRVLKFDRNGAMNLAFGARGGTSRTTAGIKLRKPIGVALESDGSLLVVDRNADRIKRFGLPNGTPTLVVPAPNPGDEYYVARDVIASEDGGAVERADRAGVIVPADALSEDLKIIVSTPTAPGWEESSRHKAIIADKSLNIVSAPIEYQPHGTSFNTPVTLVIPYSADLVATYKASEKGLKIHFWNPTKKQWEELVSEVDPIAGVVRAKTTHFSLYQVLASTATEETLTTQAAADESFAFRDLYVYPNPARGGSVPKLHLAVGVADKVSFRVFDTAGREVHRATLEGRPPVIDDGSGAKYAYEHAWEGHIPSGVYLFVVEAEKAGAAPIRKAGRFGVVR